MMEILVSVFVFAFGGVGAATMQVLAAQSNLEALQRTQAVYFATDIIERIRSNSNALAQYDAPDDNRWTIVGANSIQTEPTPDCDTAICTPAEQAVHDLWAWERAIDGHVTRRADGSPAGALLHPTGCIRNTGSGRFEVVVAWYGRTEMTDSSIAADCVVEDRYGEDSAFRRVVRLRTRF